MKNMLEEAARVSKFADELSESGSFDTTLEDFAATANDAAGPGDTPDAAIIPELVPELEPDVGTLQLDEVARQWDAVDDAEAVNDESPDVQTFAPEVADPTLTPVAPVFVRYSPLVCLALAVISATAWLSYLRIAASHDAAALGASLVQSRQPLPSVAANSVPSADRFPYIAGAEEGPVEVR